MDKYYKLKTKNALIECPAAHLLRRTVLAGKFPACRPNQVSNCKILRYLKRLRLPFGYSEVLSAPLNTLGVALKLICSQEIQDSLERRGHLVRGKQLKGLASEQPEILPNQTRQTKRTHAHPAVGSLQGCQHAATMLPENWRGSKASCLQSRPQKTGRPAAAASQASLPPIKIFACIWTMAGPINSKGF